MTGARVAIADVRAVVVGSRNPVKIAAARAVLARLAPAASVVGHEVPSGVRDQPWGDDETILGATIRARGALGLSAGDGARLGIGLEGGVVETDGGLRTCAWAAVACSDGRVGVGGSLAMPLPPRVAALVRAGDELGHAMDAVSGLSNVKHGGGAVGILTAGAIGRQQAYEVILTYALAPWIAPEHWKGGTGG